MLQEGRLNLDETPFSGKEFWYRLMDGERTFVRVPLLPQAGAKDPNT